MIRKITAQDKNAVLRLAEMFFKERIEKDGLTFSLEAASENFDQFIYNPAIVALCIEVEGEIVGMIAGVFSRMFFAKELALQELVWYVEPRKRKYGIRLLKEFERIAVGLGANLVMMVGLTGDSSLDFYRKMGYTSIQEHFIKRIG